MKNLMIPLLISLLPACGDSIGHHERILRDDLVQVKYSDGISLLEAKYIADAYLYLHGGRIGKAPHVKVRDGGAVWLCDIYGGRAISPERADSPPVTVDKKTGHVNWAEGPELSRVELPLIR